MFSGFHDTLDEQDQILIEGMEKFCVALDVDPTDVVMLVMAWHLKAEQMCEFKRAGFVQGWAELKYGSHSPNSTSHSSWPCLCGCVCYFLLLTILHLLSSNSNN